MHMATKNAHTAPEAPQRRRTRPVEKVFYIVNPAGAVHQVDREHATARLRDPRFRQATKEEIAAFEARGGNQTADDPIARPFSTALREDPELDEE